MFTGEERFIAPNAVLVSARTDAVLIDCGFVKSDVNKLLHLVKASGGTRNGGPAYLRPARS
jgi:hypothetical protein